MVAITGPRQSGKTTLAQSVFANRSYASLEDPDIRDFATTDPRGFLAQFPDGAVLDEAQRCPELFSYLQGIVDRDSRPGRFILTGSQQFGLMSGITQSLAGRVALFETWVVSELLKYRYHKAEPSNLYFWRDRTGHEVDIVVDKAGRLIPIEVKAGQTVTSDYFRGMMQWIQIAGDAAGQPWLIYAGDTPQTRQGVKVIPWRQISKWSE